MQLVRKYAADNGFVKFICGRFGAVADCIFVAEAKFYG